ncbi:MAG: YfcE family phosphodiesterase [Epulopiscium sp. Nuni2H_MBin003]|nr:MAG: YfcE family phosphodiesterase [Epulopiscium sp. Nuni2H_MBin003]
MKYLIISDVHGSKESINSAINAFHKHQCDLIILLGDILYHGPRNPLPEGFDPAGVAIRLNEYKDKIICACGNCDSEVDQMVLNFPIKAPYALIVEDGVKIFATHGHIYNPDNLPDLDTIDIFLYGHTHLYDLTLQNNLLLVNPGSISLPKENRPKTYAIYENKQVSIYKLQDDTILLTKIID